jgi:hypothetical protein
MKGEALKWFTEYDLFHFFDRTEENVRQSAHWSKTRWLDILGIPNILKDQILEEVYEELTRALVYTSVRYETLALVHEKICDSEPMLLLDSYVL